MNHCDGKEQKTKASLPADPKVKKARVGTLIFPTYLLFSASRDGVLRFLMFLKRPTKRRRDHCPSKCQLIIKM